MSDFRTLPEAPRLRLENLTAPACIPGAAAGSRRPGPDPGPRGGDVPGAAAAESRRPGPDPGPRGGDAPGAAAESRRPGPDPGPPRGGAPAPGEGLVRLDLVIENGRIADPAPAPGETVIDMAGAMVFPAFLDIHAHLDKGHIWARAPNPDGSFDGALSTVAADRAARWSAADVRRRAEFSLRCAFAHGTRAIRTHLDSLPPQHAISWPLFRELREEWAGRIELQAACLVGIDFVEDGPQWRELADMVADSGGVLGAVAWPMPDLDRRLDLFFATAAERGLAADFHVDETLDPSSNALRAIARAVRRTGFSAPVAVGHCCSLSAQPEAEALKTLDMVAEAGNIAAVSLPMCNLYLQDRAPGRTPRRRGVTLAHEMRARAIPLAFASDNTRDPFYAYGDMDMLEVMREAVRIAHLDHSRPDWPDAFFSDAAAAAGFAAPSLAPGAPADLLLFRARSWTELLARPQSDRIVLRAGRAIDRTLPDFSELDDLMAS